MLFIAHALWNEYIMCCLCIYPAVAVPVHHLTIVLMIFYIESLCTQKGGMNISFKLYFFSLTLSLQKLRLHSETFLCCWVSSTNGLKALQAFWTWGITHPATQCHISEDCNPRQHFSGEPQITHLFGSSKTACHTSSRYGPLLTVSLTSSVSIWNIFNYCEYEFNYSKTVSWQHNICNMI